MSHWVISDVQDNVFAIVQVDVCLYIKDDGVHSGDWTGTVKFDEASFSTVRVSLKVCTL